MLDESNDSSDPLDRIIDEFLNDLKENRSPTLELYQSKYPEHADQLAELLPLVASLHQNTSANPIHNPYWNLKPGSILGQYEIIREIGRGGMGIVFQAKQLELDRFVALKVLLSNPADNPQIQSKKQTRFLREAKLCSILTHPNIIPIFQHGTDQGHSFYSMQLVDGKTLSEIISKWRNDPPENPPENRAENFVESLADSVRGSKTHWLQIAQWMHDAADALETAHQHHILHRDIKPSNLIVDSQNKIWLGDFGLAKDLNHNNPDSTTSGLGTLQYMAPEALVTHATEKSDIYGLGITLFELLARIPKYKKDTHINLLRRIKDEDAPRLEQIDPRIPKDLITISQKATALLPSHRYASAAQLRDDLKRFLLGQPILARTYPLRDQCRRWIRKHQVLATWLATTTGFFVALTLLASYFWIESQRKDKAIELARRSQNQSFIDEKVASAHRAASLRKADSRSQAVKILNEASERLKGTQPNPKVQRAITDILSMPELKTVPIPQVPAAQTNLRYACDQDHRRILFLDEVGKTHLYSMPDWNHLHTFELIQKDRWISMSPNAHFATLGVSQEFTSSGIGHGLECWDLTTSPPNIKWTRENLSLGMSYWDNSSKVLYCVEFDGTILGLEPSTGEILYRLEPSGPFQEAIIYPHPTLPLLAVASYYFPEIHFRELETGTTLAIASKDRVQSFAWHPSGNEFATTHHRPILRRIQWPTGKVIDELDVNHNGGEVRYSPNGRWLAASYWGDHVELIDTATLERYETTWPWTFFSLNWSSDSRTIAINVLNGSFQRLEVDSQNGIQKTTYPYTSYRGFHSLLLDQKRRLLLTNSMDSNGKLTALDLLDGHRFSPSTNSEKDPAFVRTDHAGRFDAIDLDRSLQMTYESSPDGLTDPGTLTLKLLKTDELPFSITYPKASGDGSYFFAHPTEGQMFRWPAENPEKFHRVSVPGSKEVDFSGTGRWISVKGRLDDRLWLVDAQTDQKSMFVDGKDQRAFFSKDDKLVFLCPSNRIFDFGKWKIPTADFPDSQCQAAAFSADGQLLVWNDASTQNVIVYSLEQKREIFQFNLPEFAPVRIWITDDNTQLIVCGIGSGDVAIVVLDFAKLHAQANAIFPDIPYIPIELVRDAPKLARHTQTRTRPNLWFARTEYSETPIRPISADEFVKMWNVRSVDSKAAFEVLQQMQQTKSHANRQLCDDWDHQSKSGWGVHRLNDTAEALANTKRFNDAIAACELSLEKQPVNFDAKLIKAYSLWQNQSHQKAIQSLGDIDDDLAGEPKGWLLTLLLDYYIKASMNPKVPKNSQDFMRAIVSLRNEHPIYLLHRTLGDSMVTTEHRNLYALNLELANEIISQNNKIPYHWYILAQAKLQVGDIDGARQAVDEYVRLTNFKTYELPLKLDLE